MFPQLPNYPITQSGVPSKPDFGLLGRNYPITDAPAASRGMDALLAFWASSSQRGANNEVNVPA
jgi:hypothetical protein